MVLRELRCVRTVGSHYEFLGGRELRGFCASLTYVYTCCNMGLLVQAGYTLVSFCTFDFEVSSMHPLPVRDRWQWTSCPVSLSTIDSNPRVAHVVTFQVKLSSFFPAGTICEFGHQRGLLYSLRPVIGGGSRELFVGGLLFDGLDVMAVSIRDPRVKFFMRHEIRNAVTRGWSSSSCRMPDHWFECAEGCGVRLPFVVGVRIPPRYGADFE